MKKYISLFALATLMLFQAPLFAQTEENAPSKWALQLNFQHQDQAIEFVYGQLGTVDPVRIRPLITVEGQRFPTDHRQTQLPDPGAGN